MMDFAFLNSDADEQAADRLKRVRQSRDELNLVSLQELLQPLVKAVGQRQQWVEDFRDDQVMLSADLYEVLREFSRLQESPDTAPGIV